MGKWNSKKFAGVGSWYCAIIGTFTSQLSCTCRIQHVTENPADIN